ncbi:MULTISPECIES: hypothetical protein [unclassified Microbacterium]|uniref:hypothetical protein n=1 Tax=unclassified Microbacterium TaxID=2609290 RepID=UPI0006FAF034|nr:MULTISPECIES: hypothetical protein [unclassified Microbacterium]KQT75479.1 hypothetical protein ASG45_02985 [Microbacterium sp. Leaf436]MBD8205727.1 hypothetical protein [Microbacterium sp. CFBP 8801]MBD8217644.1 hypothetical protein [Microbacterium sp. CFBP 13617]MBD8476837.1 hypothetical protein [Microbacterium sp. CFBP 8794]MBD8509301.1 hypothetical protein [Microbacterium sp. CFBP 8790]
MSTPASEVYVVAGEDRARNGLRWASTVVLGLFDAGSVAPSVSEVVIRRVDGSIVKRLPPGDVDDFTAQLNEITADLATMSAVPFAEKWIAEPA